MARISKFNYIIIHQINKKCNINVINAKISEITNNKNIQISNYGSNYRIIGISPLRVFHPALSAGSIIIGFTSHRLHTLPKYALQQHIYRYIPLWEVTFNTCNKPKKRLTGALGVCAAQLAVNTTYLTFAIKLSKFSP